MAEIQTKVAVVGVRDTLRALRKFDPEAAKALRNELGAAAKLIQAAAKRNVPSSPPLSGWNTSDVLKPKVRLKAKTSPPGWPKWRYIKGDIRINKAQTDRDKKTKTRTTIAVYTENPAAIIYEFAKASQTPTQFSAHLPSLRSGRIMWTGHDQVADQVRRKISDALDNARKLIQTHIDNAKV